MKITFTKYQGTGNDFVIVNAFVLDDLSLDVHQIRQICERKYGVGSDGLIIIKKSEKTHFTIPMALKVFVVMARDALFILHLLRQLLMRTHVLLKQ